MTLLRTFENVARCAITKWWRPACCVGFVATLWVQGVILPLMTGMPANLPGLAALIASIVAAFAVREWGKARGTAQ